MPKNLKNVIDDVESSEKETTVLQAKVERLTELVTKQKAVMSEQEALIGEQKNKISKMFDIPEDVIELKELIGTQRSMLNEKDIELEHSKGEVAAAKKELELNQKLIAPIQNKLEESYIKLGELKTTLSEKSSGLILKTEESKGLQKEVDELRTLVENYKKGQHSEISGAREKFLEEIEQLKKEHLKEKQELTSQITKLETVMLDNKLGITEKTSEAKDLTSRFNEIRQKQEDLIKKIGVAMEQNRIANETIRSLNTTVEELQTYKKDNIDKVYYFEKLSKLMKEEPIFKTFLIIRDIKKGISMDDLRISIGSPIVLVKKFIQKFQELDLVIIKEDGKIVLKPVESA